LGGAGNSKAQFSEIASYIALVVAFGAFQALANVE
jgi:hypothetical protein